MSELSLSTLDCGSSRFSPQTTELLAQARACVSAGALQTAGSLFALAANLDCSLATRMAYASFLADVDDLDDACREWSLAWEQAKWLQSPELRAACCHNLAALHHQRGDRLSAAQYSQLALAARMEMPDPDDGLPDADALAARGADAAACGELTVAEALWRAALRMAMLSGDTSSQGEYWTNLGVIRVRQQQTAAGLRYLARGLRLLQRAGDRNGAGQALMNIGFVKQSRCQWQAAETCFARAAELLENDHRTHLAERARRFARESASRLAAELDPARN